MASGGHPLSPARRRDIIGAAVILTIDIFEQDRPPRRERFARDVIRIGALPSANLRVGGDNISRLHAEIRAEAPDRIYLRDLGSQAGTLVNGQRIQHCLLSPGDLITVGSARLVLDPSTPAPKEPERPERPEEARRAAPETPRKARRGAKGREAEVEALRAENARLQAQVRELQEELTRRCVAEVRPAPSEELLQRLRAALQARAAAHGDQLVPLPVLRRDVGAPRQDFDEALLLLEQRGEVELHPVRFVALFDVDCGIAAPERGLLYHARPSDR